VLHWQQQKKKGGIEPQVELEHDDNNKEVELQEYAVIGNFTQLQLWQMWSFQICSSF